MIEKIPLRLSVLGLSVSICATAAIPTAALAQPSAAKPTIARVRSMTNGDIMCYVTLVGDNGTVYKSVGASFEICAKEKAFLNKRVRLSYKKAPVNDCQSIEPCGKTRVETLIMKMQVIGR